VTIVSAGPILRPKPPLKSRLYAGIRGHRCEIAERRRFVTINDGPVWHFTVVRPPAASGLFFRILPRSASLQVFFIVFHFACIENPDMNLVL
jgi:hypothetical protein